MANQTQTKPLDPNASPYIKKKIPIIYLTPLLPPPHHFTVFFPPRFSTYNIRFQPKPSPPEKKINLSVTLTSVPSGPRIPKSRPHRGRCNDVKWRPKIPAVEKLTRWKNCRKEYQKSLQLEANTTTLMIKNVPNKYTRKLLIQTLDAHCEAENKKVKDDDDGCVSAYDFLYLPIDFNRRTNAGFAFVNFTTPEAALRFREAFNGKRWNRFDSLKVAEISRARIQGKEALVNNCKGMDFKYGSEEDMPVWFEPARDGSGEFESRMFRVGKCFSL